MVTEIFHFKVCFIIIREIIIENKMFKKLFGATDKKKQAAPEINPLETMQKLKEQIEVVDKRVKKLDVDMKAHVAAAL
jgi:hypothetical protein